MVLSSNIKLVFDHQIFAGQTYGGISRYFVELANQLSSQKNIDVTLLAPLHINDFFDAVDSNITVGQRIPTIPKTRPVTRLLNKHISRSWLRKHSPDIIHLTYFYPQNYSRNTSAKTVLTVYDMIHELHPEYFPASDNAASLKIRAVHEADHIICISQATKDDLLKITAVNPEKVSVVHLGINHLIQQPLSAPIFPDAPYLLFVGDRGGYKNFARLLTAYGSSAELNTAMRLICFGGGEFSNKEKAAQNRLNLDKGQIQWFGGDDSVLANLYKHATAFVYPSLYEGFGLPPLEAMSFGCPVVCSHQGSIPEVVGNAGEYFDPLNENEMVKAITRVSTDPLYAEELRNKGNLQIRKFSWQRCAEETYAIYESLL